MFLGHLGVALALKKVEPELNAAPLFVASMLPDVLLGALTLAGVEQVIAPENYARLRYMHYVFPYSHSLVATLVWSAVMFALTYLLWRGRAASRLRASLVMAAAVFLHWLCDVLVHPAQIPLAGNSSPMIGLGLWNWLAIEIAVELLITAIGLGLYWSVKPASAVRARWGMLILVVVLALVSFGGQVFSTQAPPPAAAAASWIVQTGLLALLIYWLDREPARKPALAAPA